MGCKLVFRVFEFYVGIIEVLSRFCVGRGFGCEEESVGRY